MNPPDQKKPGWDDEEDWGKPPGSVKPGEFPPTPPPRRLSVVTWMYLLAAVLIGAQIAYFYLKR